jgi:hypothetical protein
MRILVLPIVGLGISAVVLSTAFAPTANAGGAGQVHPSQDRTCYSQLDADNGAGIVSQNFEPSFDAYDSRGADDFTLSQDCVVRRIDVAGAYINGSGPARSENVTIYQDLRGLPGAVISNQPNLVGLDDGTGNLEISLLSSVSLQANQTYIVSVQVNMDFSAGGEWAWSTNNTMRGSPASWRNNQDGFGTGCVHFTQLLTCIRSTEGPDFAFAVANFRIRH